MARTLQLTVSKFVADPAAPVVTNQGTPGAANYSYKIVAVAADGTKSAASSAGSTGTGNATLSGANYNRVTWAIVPAAVSYEIHRTAGGATQGLIGTDTGTTFDDTGLTGDGSTASTSNGTGLGPEAAVTDLRDLTAQVDGTFVGTVQLQGQIQGAAGWIDVGSAKSAPDWISVSQKLDKLRCKMTAYTSGDPAVYVSGSGRV